METGTLRSITLSESWGSRVLGGSPFAARSDWLELPADCQDGEVLQLLDGSGHPLGFGIHDADNDVVRILPAEPEEKFDLPFFRDRVARAIELRDRLGLTTETGAYRLVNGEGDGLSGFLVDVYARHVIIYTFARALTAFFPLLGEAIASAMPTASITGKVRPVGETPTGKLDVLPLSPTEPPRQLVVTEDDVRYEVHLLGGLNTGLFCDMRQVRRSLRTWVGNRRVLNTFSYTGSFSLVSALSGARSVTSVDFAAGVLHWTKTNFVLNGLPAEDPRFHYSRADVFDYLKTAKRKGKEFDVVILDPPTSTTVPGRRWFMKSDYDRLIGHALRLIPVGGVLVVAANSIQSRPERLENQIRTAARDSGRRLSLLESHGLPPDFPTQMIHPEARYLKCFFLRVDR